MSEHLTSWAALRAAQGTQEETEPWHLPPLRARVKGEPVMPAPAPYEMPVAPTFDELVFGRPLPEGYVPASNAEIDRMTTRHRVLVTGVIVLAVGLTLGLTLGLMWFLGCTEMGRDLLHQTSAPPHLRKFMGS